MASMSAKGEESSMRAPISKELYDDLVHYFKYASSAYSTICPRPNSKHLVMKFSSAEVSEMQGYVARDDERKELVVAIRGSATLQDILLDSQVVLVPIVSPGFKSDSNIRVHSGFLVSWDSIALQVITILKAQLAKHKDYAIVTVGHSLGGSVALIGAVCLEHILGSSGGFRTYSYGSPRTGNKAFADYVNEKFGSRAYRVVHGNDGVPTMIPTSFGYHHHAYEYWQYTQPPSEETVFRCNANGEDESCSASIPSQGPNLAHAMYFGIVATTPFCW